MSEARTPAQIEAEITRRRQDLAETLDEIAVRVHPKTMWGDAKARAAATVDRTAGQAYVAVNRAVSGARGQLITQDGKPRMARIVPVALVTVAVATAGAAWFASRRRHR